MLDSNILIVDDEETNVVLLECMLERAGYTQLRTTTVRSRALEMAAESVPGPDAAGFAHAGVWMASR